MTHLEQLIQDLCPNGVKFVKLDSIATISIGEFVHKNKQTSDGQYPVYNGGTSNTGFYTEYNQTANKIIISARGANAGFVNKIDVPYWAGNSCYTIDVTADNANWYYVYYCLKSIESKILGKQQLGSIPAVSKKQVQDLQIPLPPLAVQSEIVRILDKFTLYKSELAAELAARCKQYEFYRNQLLNFDQNIKRVKLGEIAKIKNGKDYKKLGNGSIPVYGSGGIMTYVDTFVYNAPSVLIPRKGSLSNLFYVDTPFWNVDTIFYTEIDASIILPKFLYYTLKNLHLETLNKAGGVPSLTQDILNRVEFPLPPLSVQERIVAILDRFDTLCHDIREGLPAEIDLRQKQYEYYRDKLLTFERL